MIKGFSRYFNPSDLLSKDLLQKYKKIHHNDRLKILDEKMQNAINLTSISDRPLGVCLSGGVDSSLALLLWLKIAFEKHLRDSFLLWFQTHFQCSG